MNISKFILSLSSKELEELKEYFLSEEANQRIDAVMIAEAEMNGKPTRFSIEEFISVANSSVRLKNVLSKGILEGRFFYLDEITKQNFCAARNAGKKSWTELVYDVYEVLKLDEYKMYRTSLGQHFKIQDSVQIPDLKKER